MEQKEIWAGSKEVPRQCSVNEPVKPNNILTTEYSYLGCFWRKCQQCNLESVIG